jgi:hypothetical protein
MATPQSTSWESTEPAGAMEGRLTGGFAKAKERPPGRRSADGSAPFGRPLLPEPLQTAANVRALTALCSRQFRTECPPGSNSPGSHLALEASSHVIAVRSLLTFSLTRGGIQTDTT